MCTDVDAGTTKKTILRDLWHGVETSEPKLRRACLMIRRRRSCQQFRKKHSLTYTCHIHGLFDQEFMQGELEAWTPGRFGQFDAIDISNRYFTRRSDMNGEAPIQFSRAIDPENILTNALSNDFVHIQENIVEYYEAVEKDNKIK